MGNGKKKYQGTSSTLQDSSSSARARKWGEYTCDLPPWTLDRMLGDIAERHPDISWVIVTGVAHIGHMCNDELTKLYICTVPTVHFKCVILTFHCFTIIICPGDLPAHDVWMQSQHTNIHVAKVVPETKGNLFLLIFSRIYLIWVI